MHCHDLFTATQNDSCSDGRVGIRHLDDIIIMCPPPPPPNTLINKDTFSGPHYPHTMLYSVAPSAMTSLMVGGATSTMVWLYTTSYPKSSAQHWAHRSPSRDSATHTLLPMVTVGHDVIPSDSHPFCVVHCHVFHCCFVYNERTGRGADEPHPLNCMR